MSAPITVALAKGALLKDSVRRFGAAGLDFSAGARS
jgi:ATP phosphoribosyltransferase